MCVNWIIFHTFSVGSKSFSINLRKKILRFHACLIIWVSDTFRSAFFFLSLKFYSYRGEQHIDVFTWRKYTNKPKNRRENFSPLMSCHIINLSDCLWIFLIPYDALLHKSAVRISFAVQQINRFGYTSGNNNFHDYVDFVEPILHWAHRANPIDHRSELIN